MENHTAFIRIQLTVIQYYKPWETSAAEDDRIRDQIADANDIIKREVEEYEARQEHEANREDHISPEVDASRDAEGSHNGKEHDADAAQQPSATNGNANGSHTPPKDQDMQDDHPEDPGHEAVRHEDTNGDAMDTEVPSHETTTDDPSNDNHDDNGEDVVEEAAEDTVIY